ncbi:MAG: immunity 38 family protein [Nevskia sp.]|nr:immunity 38 family protein [Nevskia sp.]
MIRFDLESVQAEVERLAQLISARADQLPTYGTSEGSGRPHVESFASGYYYVVAERGTEHSRTPLPHKEELLYWIFRDVSFSVASEYELKHRIPGQDSRRILFAKNLELLEKLNPQWREREALRQDGILMHHPYSS